MEAKQRRIKLVKRSNSCEVERVRERRIKETKGDRRLR